MAAVGIRSSQRASPSHSRHRACGDWTNLHRIASHQPNLNVETYRQLRSRLDLVYEPFSLLSAVKRCRELSHQDSVRSVMRNYWVGGFCACEEMRRGWRIAARLLSRRRESGVDEAEFRGTGPPIGGIDQGVRSGDGERSEVDDGDAAAVDTSDGDEDVVFAIRD